MNKDLNNSSNKFLSLRPFKAIIYSRNFFRKNHRHTRNMNISLWRVVEATLGILIGGILLAIAISWLLPEQELEITSALNIDPRFSVQGSGSVLWTFHLKPQRWHRFESQLIGCYSHVEVRPDSLGNRQYLDMSPYRALKFSAKSSLEYLPIAEFNVFTDSCFCQYYDTSRSLCTLMTKWQNYEIRFEDLVLAPWDLKDKEISCGMYPKLNKDALKHVAALGWDAKVESSSLESRVWIDNLRLVDSSGNEVPFLQCDNIVEHFSDKTLWWLADWNVYVEFK